ADREGFGRRELGLSPAEIEAQISEQVAALAVCCKKAGARLAYVKPHGALYNRAVREAEAARAVVKAVHAAGALVLLCLPGSQMEKQAASSGVKTAAEAFVDRGYRADGTLVPRGETGALIEDVAAAVERALRLVTTHRLTPREGADLTIHADSLCVHGDGAQAVPLLEAVRARFTREGIRLAAFAS